MQRIIHFGLRLRSAGRKAAMLALIAVGIAARGQSNEPLHSHGKNAGSFVPVPLAAHFSFWFSNSLPTEAWSELPRARQSFDGIPFEVQGRIEVTGMEAARLGDFFPTAVTGIRVGGQAKRLHLLHGAMHTAKDGVPMAKLVLHYANGQTRSLRLAYGVHARSWVKEGTERHDALDDPNSSLVWTGTMPGENNNPNRSLRLFRTTFENPLAEAPIQQIDFVSLFSDATPFIVAITLDTTGYGPGLIPAGSGRWVKKAHQYEDDTYRKEFFVRAIDAQTGAALSNAVANLTIADDEFPFFFGETAIGANGAALLAYAPQHTLSYALQVRAHDYVPVLFTGSRTNLREFPSELTAKLHRGVMIGGLVTNKNAEPIPEAQIVAHKIVPETPKQFTRIDYAVIKTDRQGRWSTTSLPEDLTPFRFEITHPEYRPAVFSVGKTNAAFDAEALLAGQAAAGLEPALQLELIIADRNGSPVAEAHLYVQDYSNPLPVPPRLGRTDASGRFLYRRPEPMEGAIFILADGFAPKFHPINLDGDERSARIQLSPKRVFRGRVQDQSQQPVAGAQVKVDSWQNCQLITWRGETDAEGRFAWDGAPEGSISFNLSKTNFSNARYSMSGSSAESRFTMRRLSGVSGLVVDAETQKPIDEFTIVRGYSYNEYNPFRWERSSSTRGRNGRYSMRLYEYSQNGYSQILIEAPGYLPAVSQEFRTAGWYTNDFQLKRGRGISGIVQLPSGEPVSGASVVVVETSDYAYMDKPGQFRSGRSYADHIRSDAQGRFEFAAKLEAHTIMAAHEQGYAEVSASEVATNGKVVLRPWGRIEGTLRVGPKVEPDQIIVLNSWYYSYGDGKRTSPPLSLAFKATPSQDGRFVFERVPPGERKVELEYQVSGRRYYGGTPRSHGVPVDVKPGETAQVILGGSGRTVTGRIKVVGAAPEAVDWLRDTHSLYLNVPSPDIIMPSARSMAKTDEERQKMWREEEQRRRAAWQTEKGRQLDRQRRNYVLLFDTNGTFRAYNVPAGNYSINVTVSDPGEDEDSYRQIGSLHANVLVPEGTEPVDLGSFDLRVRGALRTGQRAPEFETKTFDGKTIRLADLRGKTVLLEFWATWAGSRESDLANLKTIYDTHGKDPRFVMVGFNLDHEPKPAEDFLRTNESKWPQCYIGPWNQSPIRDSFGIEGMPAAVLIDAEGRVTARNIHGSSIRTAVRNALSTTPPPGGR